MDQRRFTPREIEVALKVMDGLANKDIASDLGMTEQVVKNHVSKLLDKTGMDNRVALAMFLVRNPEWLNRSPYLASLQSIAKST